MEKTSQVDIKKLKSFIVEIFDFMEKENGMHIPLKHNLYWKIPYIEKYDLSKEAEISECGSLDDDWEFIEKASNHPEQAIPLMLLHVAPILEVLATQVKSYPKP